MNHEGFPEIFYKITADYEIDPLNMNRGNNWNWNITPSIPLIDLISRRIPSDAVGVGQDLFKVINSFKPFQNQYKLNSLGTIPADRFSADRYPYYVLTRKSAGA
jgi:hypothetical protein